VVDGVLFGALALVPLVAWLERNRLVSGSLVGATAASSYSLLQSAYLALEVVSHWLVPPLGPALPRVALTAFVLAAVAWGTVSVWRAERGAPAAGSGASARRWPIAPAVVWAKAYFVLIVVWTSVTAVEQVDERYLAPLFLPLVGLAFRALAALSGPRPGARLSRTAAVALGIAWLAYPTARTALHFQRYLADGAGGYSAPAWRRSELAAALAGRADLAPLYSNGPDAASYLAGVDVKLSPRKRAYNSREAVSGEIDSLRRALRAARAGEAHLAWFSALDRPFLYSPAELDSALDVRVDRRYVDGVLYLIRERRQTQEGESGAGGIPAKKL
jgi:hypothetical protein